MINAEEHEKLLAQIAELEKNSTNFFDVEKEFFLITSDNLAEVKTRFYGYSIQATGIYEEDNLTPEAAANLDGRGCYVYVEAKDGQITIKQDLNGCWGIYLFRHGDYFALSNSFFRLLDHVKFRYPLTVNRDYCQSPMAFSAFYDTKFAYSDMAVNEVKKLERNAALHIDIAKKNLQIELLDYKEYTVPLDSEEGIAILDRWLTFWSSVLHNVAQRTKFIQMDLSGGFDSRITFLIALSSNIPLDQVFIYSIKSKLHTYQEDYKIASQIAAHYGLKLNQPLPNSKFLNQSISDVFNMNFYAMQTNNTNSVNLYQWRKPVDKKYILSGYAGETMRGYWFEFISKSPQDFIKFITLSKPYSRDLFNKLFSSKKTIIESTFRSICDKYQIVDCNSVNPVQYLYQETRCVSHFGKFMLRNYLQNSFIFSPALDPYIRHVSINTLQCPDPRLLIALIFTRYEPNLLTFPFDSGQSIKPETIEYARKLNERFPICHKKVDNLTGGGQAFHLQPRDAQAEKILLSGQNNPAIPSNLMQSCLQATFESSKTYGLFTSYFDTELYNYVASSKNHSHMINVVGITKVLEDVDISQRNQPLYRDMQRFLEQDFVTIHKSDDQILRRLKPYISARIDVKLETKEQGDFEILSVSDDKSTLQKPDWFNKDGIGYVIQSYAGKLGFVAKTNVDGRINLNLRGMWVQNPEKSKLIPYWIDYTKLTVNDKLIFDTLTPAWHDKPYAYKTDVKAGEEIKIQVEWLPHRSDT